MTAPAATGALSQAIAGALAKAPAGDLATAARALSLRYREGVGPYVRTAEDALAYAATRLPATYAAVRAGGRQVAELWPAFAPATQLDLGAGCGAAAWAAASLWPSLARVVLADVDEHMIRVGQLLADGVAAGWDWQQLDVTCELGQAELVTACYLLGELEPAVQHDVALRAWEATTGCLLLVEPGTPAGFCLIRELRHELVEAGAHLLAPCPEEGACPVGEGDWCHFSARVARSGLHRNLKGAARSFEDEKFSYVAFARTGAARAAGRVVRRPLHRRRFAELAVCADGAIRTTGIGQSQPAYRSASRLAWGDAVPPEVLAAVRRDGRPLERG
ncbi:MAG TPA: small ribosomal subunit Rsm22 family protein [Acidimicrobiales bacterium]|nr:small ribosomal subunit Rsm22 family protein [Acidimicrobiales bacterium]